jgi:hypothetical protein
VVESSVVLYEDPSPKREHILKPMHNIRHQPIKIVACIHCFFSAESVRGLYENLPFVVCLCWLGSYDEFVGSLAILVEKGGLVLTINLDFKYA